MRIFKPKFKAKDGARRETPKWYCEFKDHRDRVRRLPGFTDKKQTEELGRKLEKLVACRSNSEPPAKDLRRWVESLPDQIRTKLAKYGLIEPQHVAACQALKSHVEAFEDALRAKGGSEKHANNVLAKVRRTFTECNFRRWPDITATMVERFLAKLRADEGMSRQTSNHYVAAVKQFCNWMVAEGKAGNSPVEQLQKLNAETDRRRERRAMTIDEFQWLLSVTITADEQFGMSGRERALLYRFAAETGYRASELRSLTRGSFALEADPPTVRVSASNSKRRKNDVLPLRSDTARLMRELLANKLPAAPVFNMPKSDRTAKMLRADLNDARQLWIQEAQNAAQRIEREQSDFLAYRNHNGLVADFHSLRSAFITYLQKGGATLPMSQSLARHSTADLTANVYTHRTIYDQRDAVECLPDLSAGFEQQEQRATGTEGAIHLASYLAEEHSETSNSVHLGAEHENRRNRTHPIKQANDAVNCLRMGGRVVEGGSLENY